MLLYCYFSISLYNRRILSKNIYYIYIYYTIKKENEEICKQFFTSQFQLRSPVYEIDVHAHTLAAQYFILKYLTAK